MSFPAVQIVGPGPGGAPSVGRTPAAVDPFLLEQILAGALQAGAGARQTQSPARAPQPGLGDLLQNAAGVGNPFTAVEQQQIAEQRAQQAAASGVDPSQILSIFSPGQFQGDFAPTGVEDAEEARRQQEIARALDVAPAQPAPQQSSGRSTAGGLGQILRLDRDWETAPG